MRQTDEPLTPLQLNIEPMDLDKDDRPFIRQKFTRRRKRLRTKTKKPKKNVDILDMPKTPHNTTQYLLQHRSYEEFDPEDNTGSMLNACCSNFGSVYNLTL